MQPHVRMLEQEGAHRLRLMGREIVRDDVNRAPLRLTGDDVAVGAGVAGGWGVGLGVLTGDDVAVGTGVLNNTDCDVGAASPVD